MINVIANSTLYLLFVLFVFGGEFLDPLQAHTVIHLVGLGGEHFDLLHLSLGLGHFLERRLLAAKHRTFAVSIVLVTQRDTTYNLPRT